MAKLLGWLLLITGLIATYVIKEPTLGDSVFVGLWIIAGAILAK